MVKYRSVRRPTSYRSDKGHNTASRNLYRMTDLYRRLSDLYGRPKLRRGYSSGSYFPSRRQGYSGSSPSYRPRTAYRPRIQYRPEPPYRPQPRQSITRSSDKPWIEPSRYTPQRIRTEPDVEKMLKELEKRFDEKLEERILERMEVEFQELQEAMKSEAVSPESQEQEARIETAEATNKEARPEKPDNIEANQVHEVANAIETGKESEPQTKAEVPAEKAKAEELPTEDELFEPEDELEWLREQTGEAEAGAETKATESEQTSGELVEKTLEPTASQEPIEPLENQPLDEAASLENPVAIGPEQLEGLEELLDQIEPLDEIEPTEIGIESMPGLLPEVLPEEVADEAAEGEAY